MGTASALVAAGVAGSPLQDRQHTNGKEAPMHLGLVTYNVARDWDLDTLLSVCKAVGLEGLEFRTTHKHGVEPDMAADLRADLRKRCADAGLKQWSLGTVCEFHSPDDAVVRQNISTCLDFIRLARDIGARGVKVRPNALPEGVPVERTLERIGNALRECGKMAADHQVEIWLEVHGRGTSEPPHIRRIMEVCDHPAVGVTWNSNPTDVVGGSVTGSFRLLARYIRCCHITNLWDASYPWRELFRLLAQEKPGTFTLCEVGVPMPPDAGSAFLRCYAALSRELQR